jgi:CheY-like chemotaxis protein
MGTIAIVDDNESAAKSVAGILEISGMGEIKVYASAVGLLEAMRGGFRPDIVISDFYMPEMNGVELLDTIVELFGAVPGIIMTGYPEGIPSESRLNNHYTVLCKGQSRFFKDLNQTIKQLRQNGEGRLSSVLSRESAGFSFTTQDSA